MSQGLKPKPGDRVRRLVGRNAAGQPSYAVGTVVSERSRGSRALEYAVEWDMPQDGRTVVTVPAVDFLRAEWERAEPPPTAPLPATHTPPTGREPLRAAGIGLLAAVSVGVVGVVLVVVGMSVEALWVLAWMGLLVFLLGVVLLIALPLAGLTLGGATLIYRRHTESLALRGRVSARPGAPTPPPRDGEGGRSPGGPWTPRKGARIGLLVALGVIAAGMATTGFSLAAASGQTDHWSDSLLSLGLYLVSFGTLGLIVLPLIGLAIGGLFGLLANDRRRTNAEPATERNPAAAENANDPPSGR